MATIINPAQRIEIESALRALNADFCYFLDHRQTDRLVELFTVEAIYTHQHRESRGREAINELMTARNASGTRTARHVQTGLRLDIRNAQFALGKSVCMTFAADISPPVPHALPHLIADFSDEYVNDQDGVWRISRRHIERIFVAPENQGPIGAAANSATTSAGSTGK